VFLRVEKLKNGFLTNSDTDFMGTAHGVLRAYYKYTSGAPWVRIYDTITYQETLGSYYNASTCNTRRLCIDGPGMDWQNM
jgi:hypothetical protein